MCLPDRGGSSSWQLNGNGNGVGRLVLANNGCLLSLFMPGFVQFCQKYEHVLHLSEELAIRGVPGRASRPRPNHSSSQTTAATHRTLPRKIAATDCQAHANESHSATSAVYPQSVSFGQRTRNVILCLQRYVYILVILDDQRSCIEGDQPLKAILIISLNIGSLPN